MKRVHRHGQVMECSCDDPPGNYARCYLLQEDETPEGFGELVLRASVDLNRNRVILRLHQPRLGPGEEGKLVIKLDAAAYMTEPRNTIDPGARLWGSEVKIKTWWFSDGTLEERVRDEVRKALVRTSDDYIAKRSNEDVEAAVLDAVGGGLNTGGPARHVGFGSYINPSPIKHLRPPDPDPFDGPPTQ